MAERELVDAAILAGAPVKEERDPLLEGTGIRKKSLLPILGKPMIRYVEEALRTSGRVGRIVAMGLDPEDEVSFTGPVDRVPSQGTIIDNILGGLDYFRKKGDVSRYMLVISSDAPLVTGPILARLIDASFAKGGDMLYVVVEKQVMEARFPGSGRSFVHLRGGNYAGGDAFVFRSAVPVQKQQMLRDLMTQRKDAMKMARVLGPGLLIGFGLGLFDLHGAERRVSKVLGLEGHAIVSPDPEVAMDVDKPSQLELVTAYLRRMRGEAGQT